MSTSSQTASPPTICYDEFDPPPLISSSAILGTGFFLFVLAMIWPPLVLLVGFVASLVVPYSYRVNDDGPSRRLMMQQFLENDPIAIKRSNAFPEDKVRLVSSFWKNPRGLLLHSIVMIPKDQPVKAVICFCHGYIDNPSYTKAPELSYLCHTGGLAIILVEYEGHGQSDGALGLVKDWDTLVEDAHSFFQETLADRFPGVTAFLMGESMGGAVAYTMIQKYPEPYRGVVLMCPMCKIADDMMPPDFVVNAFRMIAGPTGTATHVGYLPLAPSKGDLQKFSFKLDEKRRECVRHPAVFNRKPRLATAREMLDATKRITASLGDFDAPFLVQHGLSDRVTDPQLSQALYDEASSDDKTIRLYDGMWHALPGEPDDNIAKVYKDTIEWVTDRLGPKDSKKNQ
ncbi:acylglycerol lipase [Nitzschia inconspicua]|uniref:Acylglycerol lipase n=1 Tax=Nitzschia inconspicua TaxID=303405 RepID=A0A9K3L5J7_9STRA|nr:acylglycerol lipase [Nitzschia inconspicua]